jgi:flagellin-like protein
MNKYKRFIKNTKAISPIFATLILIAIAVIAGVVVYMFTSGFLAGNATNTNAAQEKLAVSGASYDATGLSVTVYVQDMTSTDTVTVTGLLVKDGSGTIASATITPTDITQALGLVPITGDLAAALNTGVYTVTVTTEGGGSFVSPSFTVS